MIPGLIPGHSGLDSGSGGLTLIRLDLGFSLNLGRVVHGLTLIVVVDCFALDLRDCSVKSSNQFSEGTLEIGFWNPGLDQGPDPH